MLTQLALPAEGGAGNADDLTPAEQKAGEIAAEFLRDGLIFKDDISTSIQLSVNDAAPQNDAYSIVMSEFADPSDISPNSVSAAIASGTSNSDSPSSNAEKAVVAAALLALPRHQMRRKSRKEGEQKAD